MNQHCNLIICTIFISLIALKHQGQVLFFFPGGDHNDPLSNKFINPIITFNLFFSGMTSATTCNISHPNSIIPESTLDNL